LCPTPLIPYHYFLVTSKYMEEDDGEMLSAPIKGITESQPCKREANSSKEHPATPDNASVRNYSTCHCNNYLFMCMLLFLAVCIVCQMDK